jgi:hypothetical protein
MPKKILNIEQKIENNNKFFSIENEEGPIIGFSVWPSIWCMDYRHTHNLAGKENVKPEEIDIDGLLADDYEYFEKNKNLAGSSIWAFSPFPAIPWMDVIMGGRLEISRSFAPSTHPTDITKAIFKNGKVFRDKKWENKLLEYIKRLVIFSKEKAPVAAPNLRGPSDLLQLLFEDGYTNFIFNLFDKPESMKLVIDSLANFYIEIRRKTFELVPSFYNGSIVINHNIWLPGQTFFLQEDASGSLLSLDLYKEFIYSSDCKIINNYPNIVFHLHSGFLNINMIDFLINNKALNFVTNIVLDPPSPEQINNVLIEIIEKSLGTKRPVYIDCGDYPMGWILELIGRLPDRGKGVFLQIRAKNEEDSREKISELNSYIKSIYDF